MNGIKLVFSDVDNTLVAAGDVFSENLKAAIKKCNENNVAFVLCSGRPAQNLIKIARNLADDGVHLMYVAGFNGCEIYDLNNNEYLYRETLVRPDVVMKKLNNLNMDYLVLGDDTIYSTNLENEFSIKVANSTKINVELLVDIPLTPKVVALVHPNGMVEALEKTKLNLSAYTVADSGPGFIDITNKNSDKGAGLVKIAKLLNVSFDNVICFGDAGNDLSMFKVCKNGIAVSNATDEIKNLASEVIESVHDDGVAKYILDHL